MNFFKNLFHSKKNKNDIEKLIQLAESFILEYPESDEFNQISEAYKHYKFAFTAFVDELNQNSAKKIIDKIEKHIYESIKIAPKNALLFHECFGLINGTANYLPQNNQRWVAEAVSRIGTLWPEMANSWSYWNQSQNKYKNGAGFLSVIACPYNPHAWFALKYEKIMYDDDNTFSDKYEYLEEKLRDVQGYDLLKKSQNQ